MKKLLVTGLVGLGLVVGVNASEIRDTTINFYGVGSKTDKNQNSSVGTGIMFDSEDVKIKLETTSDFIKTGAVLKFNPNDGKFYIKLGANYINQKMYAPDNTTARVNQYSGALATGYMLQNDLYMEIGGAYTQLNGNAIGASYEVTDETTKLAYIEVAKRWDSSLGTIDTTLNTGKVFHEFSNDKFSSGIAVDYYPINNAKLGYKYQYEGNSITNVYSAQYGYAFAEYIDNISTDTYQVNAGVKVAFENIFDFSSYRMPEQIKPHLSELHRFESISFSTNMEIQSTKGVKMTQAAIDKIEAESKNSVENEVVADTNTTIINANTIITSPTLSSKTHNSINTVVGTFTDSDGVRNVTVKLYSNSTLTALVGTNMSGDFSGLSSSTTYYAITSGEALNATTETWEVKTSSAISITTDATPDASTTITSPTLTSKTYYSINTSIGTLSDDDGVRNVTVKLYSNSALTALVGTNTSGDFSGLSSSTTYYAVTSGEALNATTETWEVKTSSAISITTDTTLPSAPPPAPPVPPAGQGE